MADREKVLKTPLTRGEWGVLVEGSFDGIGCCLTGDQIRRISVTIENGGFAEEKPTWRDVCNYYRVDDRYDLPPFDSLLHEAAEVGLYPHVAATRKNNGWCLSLPGVEHQYKVTYLFEVRYALAAEIYGKDKQVNVKHLISEISTIREGEGIM